MHQLPKIRDPSHDLSNEDCQCQKDRVRPLDRIHRTLPFQVPNSSTEDFIQDEEGFPVLDEQTGQGIFDDLKNF